jgi:hypothetical protein
MDNSHFLCLDMTKCVNYGSDMSNFRAIIQNFPNPCLYFYFFTKKILLDFLLNPFLFTKNKWLFISSEGFSTLETNILICNQSATLPIK